MPPTGPISLGAFVSRHFTWKEALWLPQWSMCHEPTYTETHRIADLASKMDEVRDFLGVPLQVTSWIRPTLDRGDYNALIGGARDSQHKLGAAVDVVPQGRTVDECMGEILKAGLLEQLGLRAEANGESQDRPWLHFDSLPMMFGEYRVVGPGTSRSIEQGNFAITSPLTPADVRG
jgi:hypothetical protein